MDVKRGKKLRTVSILLVGVLLGWASHWWWTLEEGAYLFRDQLSKSSDQPELTVSNGSISAVSESISVTDDVEIEPVSGDRKTDNDFSARADWFTCIDEIDQYAPCRQALLAFAKNKNSTSELIHYLELWLLEHPDDLQAGLVLVDTLVSDRRIFAAIDELEKLKSYQFDVDAVEQFKREVESLIRSNSRMFHDNNELEGLVALYQIMIEVDPQNARWRYELSGLFNKIDQRERALDLLSYILYDAVYGEKATARYQAISQLVKASSNPDIPLVGNDSQFLVEAIVNDLVPLRLLIDTGASITSIDKNILGQISNRGASTSRGTLQTVNGRVDTTLVKLNSLRVGGFSVREIEAAAIEPIAEHFDGLLGMDFLGQFKFAIDQERKVLFLDQRGSQ